VGLKAKAAADGGGALRSCRRRERGEPDVRGTFRPTIVALAALVPTAALAEGIELDSREYKLMLKPVHFAGGAPGQAVDRFVREQLEPAVRQSFGGKAADELQEKGFDLDERRRVRFWDTADCALIRSGFALRERVDLHEDGRPASEPELTLKFRSSDLFLAASMRLEARAGAKDVESKLEEDLGALAVRSASGDAVVAMPRSSRSQFSRSTSQTIDRDAVPRTLKEIDELYLKFDDDLRLVASENDMSVALAPSPAYRELVYESSMLDLAKDTKAGFALTIWYEGADERERPALAEISFAYDTDDGAVSGQAARRGRELLLALQDLDWADPGAPTKTVLAGCAG
jgi:hypothetical protein